MNLNDPFILRQIIMSHYQKPENKGFISDDESKRFRINSPQCVDDITVEVILNNDIITSAKFEGVACTVSTASTDIICSLITKKTKAEANKILFEYESMLKNEEYNSEILKEAVAFKNTYKQKNRLRCAKIGTDAIKELIS